MKALPVVLRTGARVSVDAYGLALDLEARGISLSPLPGGGIQVAPSERVTAEDKPRLAQLFGELHHIACARPRVVG